MTKKRMNLKTQKPKNLRTDELMNKVFLFFRSFVFTFFGLILLCFFCLPVVAVESALPEPEGMVTDYAYLLTPEYKDKITVLCTTLKEKTGAELAVATVKMTAPLDPKTYAVKLFQKWGIGQKGKDNGVLFLVSKEDKRVEIEVGYGLEGMLTDGKVGEILDKYVTPYFKQENYGEGIYQGAQAISLVVAGQKLKPAPNPGFNLKVDRVSVVGFLEMLVVAFSVIVLVVIYAVSGGAMWGRGIAVAGGAIIGLVLGGIFGAIFGIIIAWIITNNNVWKGGFRGGDFRGGFPGYGGFGGSGGFGGFGGGRSGGGGAGRSW
ncbi:MAG: TPM domain-containing protein [Candidatus Saganbacteria bacterium]|nr:TPM domain-containing protein [Candidatus Saganbacteria bacterium]